MEVYGFAAHLYAGPALTFRGVKQAPRRIDTWPEKLGASPDNRKQGSNGAEVKTPLTIRHQLDNQTERKNQNRQANLFVNKEMPERDDRTKGEPNGTNEAKERKARDKTGDEYRRENSQALITLNEKLELARDAAGATDFIRNLRGFRGCRGLFAIACGCS
jgi:hypothetical protein